MSHNATSISILLELEHFVPSTGRVNARLTEMQDTDGITIYLYAKSSAPDSYKVPQ